MANDKEILKKLFEVVAKQQKILTKLAQVSPGQLSPDRATKDIVREVRAGLSIQENAAVSLKQSADKVRVFFKTQMPDASKDALFKKINEIAASYNPPYLAEEVAADPNL
jgi:hypothetical protein